MIHILTKEKTLLNQFIAELRNKEIQKDSMRFRKNLERIGEVFAYEISKYLDYKKEKVYTPLDVSPVETLKSKIVIATILRAGLPFHNGFLNYFDTAENAFISAHRKYLENNSFTIEFNNISSPSLHNKVLILTDPMLATGSSMLITYKALLERGTPKHTHIATIIASKQGINYLKKNIPENEVTIWAGDVDPKLSSSKSYIVPGIGDAGDLAFGSKM